MVMKRWSDVCLEAFCPEAGVGFLYSEISDSASLIAKRLGYSDLEKAVLNSLFSAFSTLALVLNRDNLDAIEIKCCSNGAIGGYFIRVTSRGEICGFIHNKIPPLVKKQEDFAESEFFNYVCGNRATIDIVRYDDKNKKVDALFVADISPWPDVILKHCIENYMKQEVETIVNFINPAMQNTSHTIVVTNLGRPGRNNIFKRIVSKEGIAKIQEILTICPSISAFRVELELPDLISGPNLTIQPGCICNDKDIKKQYEKVSDVEFKQLAQFVERTATHELYRYEFRCHCCGQLYTIERSYPVEQA